MTRQLAKGMTMFLLLAGLAFVATAVSANAQSSLTSRANIPFDFSVGSKALSAGAYTVSRATAGGNVAQIRQRNGKDSAMVLTMNLRASKPSEKSKLVFRRYGSRYFLSEIWDAGETSGHKLMKSKEERAIERELASIRTRSHTAPAGYELVEVALFRN